MGLIQMTTAESPVRQLGGLRGPSWRQAEIPCGVAEGGEDPWLCGPGFGRVCLCRGMVGLSYAPVQELSSGLRRQPGAVNYSAGRPGRAYACAGPIATRAVRWWESLLRGTPWASPG
jgi:hypothetical protein